MAETRTVTLSDLIQPTDRQRDAFAALRDPAVTFLLYGGAGGGGKSYFLRWGLLRQLLWLAGVGVPGAHVCLFSMDYPTLEDRQIGKIKREFPDWLGELKETRADGLGFYLRPEHGGGILKLRNLDDPSKYKSAEFAAIGVEELTENPLQVFDDLRWRLRWAGVAVPKFIGATNPGGIGHAWVRSYWIDREYPPELQPRAGEFKYIPAKVDDNPHVQLSYIKELDSLPDHMRAALREGSWDVFAGQVFQEFRREIHVCKPFRIPEWWPRWLANDPGYTDPSLWYWMAADGDGDVYVYRERKFDRTEPSEQAKQVIAAMTHTVDGRAWVEPVQFCVTGMDAFVRQRETGKSIVDYYEAGGLQGFREPDHGAGCRGRRATIVHEYLRPFEREGKLTARVHIFDTCRELIRTLPTLTADEHDPEAVAECSVDHAFDAFGYGLQAWHAKRAHAPKAPVIRPGTAGDILGHRDILAPKKQDKAFEFAKE